MWGGPTQEAGVFFANLGEGDDERVEGFSLVRRDGFLPTVEKELDKCRKVCRGGYACFVLQEVGGSGDGVLQQVALE